MAYPDWEPTITSREVREVEAIVRDLFTDPGEREGLLQLATSRYEDRDAVLDWLALQSGDRALDLGCGIGWFSIPMAEQVGARGRVWALEVRSNPLEILKRRLAWRRPLGEALRPRFSEPSRTGLPPATLDAALFVHLGFLLRSPADPETTTLLRDVHRALRADGRLVVAQWMEGPEGDDILSLVLNLEDAGFELLDWTYDEVHETWMLELVKL
jgi:SAM-dependent methyltransferase